MHGNGCLSAPCQNGGACAPDRRGPTSDWKYVEGRCPNGFVPISRNEADGEAAAAALNQIVCEWCIASLGANEDHRISGRGYGGPPLKVFSEFRAIAQILRICN
eukprot:SAG31_NODE_62_length_28678_cov_21.548270_3_plen_104_part_00